MTNHPYNNKKPASGGNGQYNVAPYNTALAGMNQQNYQEEFRQAMRNHGIDYQATIIADGQIHRFAHQGRGDKDCWYVSFGMAGAFGDWSRGIKESWSIKLDNLPLEKQRIIQQQILDSQAKTQEETQRRYEEAAQQANTIWEKAQPKGNSEYLNRKKVDPIGIRFQGSTVIVPLRDVSGELWSLQYVYENGEKRFLSGARKKGCFHILGELNQSTQQIFVTEGYATGTSVYMATEITTLVAFDAGNLEPVVTAVKQKYPNLKITIAADNDCWREDGKNIGKEKAMEIQNQHGDCLK